MVHRDQLGVEIDQLILLINLISFEPLRIPHCNMGETFCFKRNTMISVKLNNSVVIYLIISDNHEEHVI